MHIDSYSFGKMTIDGVDYHTDLFAFADTVFPDWWRKQGHSLCPQDLDELMQYHPDLLIIGTGAASQMKVPKQTVQYIEDKGIDLTTARTSKAVDIFNQAIVAGRKVAAAFHLTC